MQRNGPDDGGHDGCIVVVTIWMLVPVTATCVRDLRNGAFPAQICHRSVMSFLLRLLKTVACVALFLVATGCRSSRPVATSPSADSSDARSTSHQDSDAAGLERSRRANANLEALYWARRDSGLTRFTRADADFMTGMISHHAQALVMSALAPTHDAGPAVLRLTSRIINAQRDEIKTMQTWLRDRGLAVPTIEIDGLTLTVHGVDEMMMHMPGMLSDEQLIDLDAARGDEFDRLFLTFMIQHHSGAVTMVDKLFSTDGAGQDELAFKLASDINVDQRTEIARMKRMLARYGSSD